MFLERLRGGHDGRVVEDGRPHDLRRGAGPFAAAWRLQQRAFGAEGGAGVIPPRVVGRRGLLGVADGALLGPGAEAALAARARRRGA